MLIDTIWYYWQLEYSDTPVLWTWKRMMKMTVEIYHS